MSWFLRNYPHKIEEHSDWDYWGNFISQIPQLVDVVEANQLSIEQLENNVSLLEQSQQTQDTQISNLRNDVDQLEQSQQTQDTQIDSIFNSINNILSLLSSLLPIPTYNDIQDLKNLYSDVKFYFELFADYFHLIDIIDVFISSAAAGDTILNVSDSSILQIGSEYVLSDGVNFEVVKIQSVDSPTQVTIESPLQYNYSTASLSKTNWTLTGRETQLSTGDIYFSRTFEFREPENLNFFIRTNTPDESIRVYRKVDTGWEMLSWVGKVNVGDGWYDYQYYIENVNSLELKLEAVNSTTVKHLVLTNVTISVHDIQYRPPEQPTNLNPADGAVDVNPNVTLEATTYEHVLGVGQSASQFQVSIDIDFQNLVFDSGETSPSPSFTIPVGTLDYETTYYWRVRYKSATGVWSDWSSPSSFTTDQETVAYIQTPVNIHPPDGDIGQILTPVLEGSAFTVVNGTDTHAASQWQIRKTSDGYQNLVWNSGEDTTNLTTVTVPDGVLDYDTSYSWRVRYKGSSLGWSQWSADTSFKTKTEDVFVIGLAKYTFLRIFRGWKYIDEYGNFITPEPNYFNRHPVYAGIQDAIIDGQYMVRIPKFYYKVGNGPSGSDASGMLCRWVSNVPRPGFKVHPAFIHNGTELDYIFIGKYESVNDPNSVTPMAASLPNYLPINDININEAISLCNARNVGRVRGFHLWNIYELGAIQLLMLIEMGSGDSQAVIGPGNVNSGSPKVTGASGLQWRGIYDLWGNMGCFVDGFRVSNNNNSILIFDTNGNQTYVDTRIVMTTTRGTIAGMYTNSGNGFDLSAVFIPNSVYGGTFSTHYNDRLDPGKFADATVCVHGGDYNDGNNAGLFRYDLRPKENTRKKEYGFRLAKI